MRKLRNKLPYVKPSIAKVIEGGTGAVTASQALVNLNAVPASLIDKAGGVLSLDSDKKLKPEVIAGLSVTGISIDGPTSMTINQVQNFTITDYDSFLSYSISAIGGSVSRSGNTITYTAPATAGASGFIINGKTITVAVGANIVMAPSITNIINGATNIDSTISLTGSIFTVSSGSDTHQFTDWQIATDNAFTNIISQSISDTVNKISWVSGTLQPATTYYARVRYKGNAYGYSNWSSIITFTTKSRFLPTSEQAILTASDKTGSDLFGYSVSINTDGTRVAIGARFSYPGAAGAVYIFFKSGLSWIQEAKLSASDRALNDNFGVSVCINSDATRLVVGSENADSSSNDSGKAYVFLRTGTSWAQEAILMASDKSASYHFGFAVTIDDAANRCMVSAPTRESARGGVYVYLRTGTSWAEEAIINADSPHVNSHFGYSISVDSTGTRIAIGAYTHLISSVVQGKVFVYIRSGTVWTLEQGFTSSDGTNGDKFGTSVSIDSSGTRIAIGASYAEVGIITLAGKVYIFTRSGTSWAEEAILTASDKAVNNYFGNSVSINDDGTRVVIGSPSAAADGISNVGKGYIFTRSGTSWSEGGVNIPITKAVNDKFGHAVSISKNGSTVAVGAFFADMGGKTDSGKVIIFG